MIENDFLLSDRITKIKSVVEKYGEDNFYISFSGGKDSTVLSSLIDDAIPGNSIPRVYADTGIELNMVRNFVIDKSNTDSRFEIIKPSVPIKQMLEAEGYPFKSKRHSLHVCRYQNNGMMESVKQYLGAGKWGKKYQCPEMLKYQFSNSFDIQISDKCCIRMKEEPLKQWSVKNKKPYAILGTMREEGGRRDRLQCLSIKGKKLFTFQPMAVVTKEWEYWAIKECNISICDIYYPPYNFIRTGCKGCPFALHLQDELNILQQYFPSERKQCEIIWKPVYEEYRRLGYRLDKDEQIKGQMSIEDFIK